jgi:hypothetical protein
LGQGTIRSALKVQIVRLSTSDIEGCICDLEVPVDDAHGCRVRSGTGRNVKLSILYSDFGTGAPCRHYVQPVQRRILEGTTCRNHLIEGEEEKRGREGWEGKNP